MKQQNKYELTKYHNDLNRVSTRGWTSEEMDFFFLIISKVRDQGTQELIFSKNELVKAAGYSGKDLSRLRERLARLAKHVGGLNYLHQTKTVIEVWHMFNRFKIEWTDDYSDFNAYIEVSPHFEYLANELQANFTSFEFQEFAGLRSTYSKTLYRLLKQYRQTGNAYFNLEEFKFLMGIPKNYKSNNISQIVFAPCLKELSPIFEGLEITTRKAHTRGNPILGYEFSWKPVIAKKYIPAEEYREQKKKENAIHKKETITLPEHYDKIPTEKGTDEDVKKVLELQQQVLGNTDKDQAQNYSLYPESWALDYELWEAGILTSSEFLQRSGLNGGTFYNLLKKYRLERKNRSENK